MLTKYLLSLISLLLITYIGHILFIIGPTDNGWQIFLISGILIICLFTISVIEF